MDSLASLAYPGHGHTIRYEYGLFKQKIENGYQIELPDQWMQTGFNLSLIHIYRSFPKRYIKYYW